MLSIFIRNRLSSFTRLARTEYACKYCGTKYDSYYWGYYEGLEVAQEISGYAPDKLHILNELKEEVTDMGNKNYTIKSQAERAYFNGKLNGLNKAIDIILENP